MKHRSGCLKNTDFSKNKNEFTDSIEDMFTKGIWIKQLAYCGKLFVKVEGAQGYVDVGDRIMEYKIYDADGFISAVDRRYI